MYGSARRVPMTRDQVDRALRALDEGFARVAAAMYAMDDHPGQHLLRDTPPQGRTEALAAELTRHIAVAWSYFTVLGTLLQRARSVRDRRTRPGEEELAVLTRLLRDPAVRLDATGAALDEQAAGAAAAWITLPELADRAERISADLIRRLTELATAAARLREQLDPPGTALADLRARADELGPHALPLGTLDRLGADLAELHRLVSADPWGATYDPPTVEAVGARLRELTVEVEAVRVRVGELSRLRADHPGRLARIRQALTELSAAEAETARSHALVLRKIADPHLPPAPDSAPALTAHLAQLDQLRREGRWSRLAEELDTVERGIAAAVERAAQLREAADGLLRRRDELRGRLAAYRAKAGRLGLIEDAGLGRLYRTAEDLLHRAPCDLPAATRAVVAYQRRLNDPTAPPMPARREPPT